LRRGEQPEIRPFAGTRRDAQGLIEVDAETFQQCHYTPAQLVDLLSEPGQWAAVAVDGPVVAGFVSAFATHSLDGRRWEVDELAVRSAYRGRGLATCLVGLATRHGATAGLPGARALVATANVASRRAFERNMFCARERVDLMLYEIGGRVPRPQAAGAPAVREAAPGDAASVAGLGGYALDEVAHLIGEPGHVYLLAEDGEVLLGYAELIEVHTLQYRGFWLESMRFRAKESGANAPQGDAGWSGVARTAKALAGGALEVAKRRADLDLVGHLAPPGDWRVPGRPDPYAACISEGFRYMGAYHVLVRDLEP
jgi:ribosomal protein S18 acetylase RimI-like enzyme